MADEGETEGKRVLREEGGVSEPGKAEASKRVGVQRPAGEIGGHTVQPEEQAGPNPVPPDSTSKTSAPPQPGEDEDKAARLQRASAPAGDRSRTVPVAPDKTTSPDEAAKAPAAPGTLSAGDAGAGASGARAARPGSDEGAGVGNARGSAPRRKGSPALPSGLDPIGPMGPPPSQIAKPTGTGPLGDAPPVDVERQAHAVGYQAVTPAPVENPPMPGSHPGANQRGAAPAPGSGRVQAGAQRQAAASHPVEPEPEAHQDEGRGPPDAGGRGQQQGTGRRDRSRWDRPAGEVSDDAERPASGRGGDAKAD